MPASGGGYKEMSSILADPRISSPNAGGWWGLWGLSQWVPLCTSRDMQPKKTLSHISESGLQKRCSKLLFKLNAEKQEQSCAFVLTSRNIKKIYFHFEWNFPDCLLSPHREMEESLLFAVVLLGSRPPPLPSSADTSIMDPPALSLTLSSFCKQ